MMMSGINFDGRPVTANRPPRQRATWVDTLDWLSMVMTIAGALNWGLVGLFAFDPIAQLFGSMTVVARVVYGLIGVSAVYGLIVAYRLGPRRS